MSNLKSKFVTQNAFTLIKLSKLLVISSVAKQSIYRLFLKKPGRLITASPPAPRNDAFTLIELSIVLVIIGLIVGGVLVGKDLIAAAVIRKTISQKEQIDTAIQTFRLKYNCLAGDCVNAEQFGFKARGTSQGQGDGNGLIEGSGPASGNPLGLYFAGGETLLLWTDLIDAGFFANQKLTRPTASTSCNNAGTGGTYPLTDCLPVANINSQMFWLSYSYQGENLLTLQKVRNIYAWGNINTQQDVPGLAAAQAFSIETKLDDGYPLTGSVKAKYISYYINAGRPMVSTQMKAHPVPQLRLQPRIHAMIMRIPQALLSNIPWQIPLTPI